MRENRVMVVGAGIAGMAAGMNLAALGCPVYLLDTAPAIGGSMHLLDHTFPTDSCGICLMLPQQPAYCPTLECQQRENVTLLPYTELVQLDGEAGAFRAVVRHKARFVYADKCDGCGQCGTVCPEARPHDHEGWLAPVKAIYRPAGLRAVPDTWVVDMAYCTRCGKCVEACPKGAIDLTMESQQEVLEVGAVVLAPGFAPFDARLKGEYGYGVYKNVVTALEFERMASLAGSTGARLTRPSDGARPKRVAFIQCVGSRDERCGMGHCSSACCMYTAKQVALAMQIEPELEATVFFMDLRAFGKDFEAYIERVQALPGVTYQRAMPSRVHVQPQTQELRVGYVGNDGRLREEDYDLVVLAVGFGPPAGMRTLAQQLGVELNEYGFALSDATQPLRTSQPGVFTAGAFREPKDIPETVVEAGGAAAEAAAFLQGSHDAARTRSNGRTEGASEILSETAPDLPLRDVSDEKPKIGVFVCECNGDLTPMGVPEVVAWAAKQPGVAISLAIPLGCTAEGMAAIRETIEREGLNRVVVAGCSHRLFTGEFEKLMRSAGLDVRLLERVNLREQVVYPHQGNGHAVTQKAQSLVGMAVASLGTMAGLPALSLGGRQVLTQSALVVGGGAAGMAAARTLAGLGIPVELVEREQQLGGQWRHIWQQPDGSDPQAALAKIVAEVDADPHIRVHLGSKVREWGGTPGAYRSVIVKNDQEETVEHGVLIVAAGGGPVHTSEYLHGRHSAVITQRELEELLASRSRPRGAEGPGGAGSAEVVETPESRIQNLKSVVMIQCVGSREPGRPYCSRVCCTQAVKNALALKRAVPDVNVYVLYREVRTYGFRERYYEAAREAGIVFLRYELPEKPVVQEEGERLRVRLTEPVTGQLFEVGADLLVLSVGVQCEAEGADDLSQILGLDLDANGFFQEEHPKMKPLDLGKAGAFVAGLAHSPRFLDESLAQGQGAAMRAAAYLGQGVLAEQRTSVWVNSRLCSFCGLCVTACPFGARVMNYSAKVADVVYPLCQGCGVCAMVCPNKATLQKAFEHKQLMAAVDVALS